MKHRKLRIAFSMICGIAFVFTLLMFIGEIEFALTFKSNPPPRPFNAIMLGSVVTSSLFALTIVSALPWLHWPPRFSVRALAIVMTVIAIGLGLFAWVIRWHP